MGGSDGVDQIFLNAGVIDELGDRSGQLGVEVAGLAARASAAIAAAGFGYWDQWRDTAGVLAAQSADLGGEVVRLKATAIKVRFADAAEGLLGAGLALIQATGQQLAHLAPGTLAVPGVTPSAIRSTLPLFAAGAALAAAVDMYRKLLAEGWQVGPTGKLQRPHPGPKLVPRQPAIPELPAGLLPGAGKVVLLQTSPKGNDFGEILALGTRRKPPEQGSIKNSAGKLEKIEIVTVGDHIAVFGCLMTSFAMLLADRGANTSVVDIYRANYDLKHGRTGAFDEAVRNGEVNLDNLLLDADAIKNANPDYVESTTYLRPGDPNKDVTHQLQDLIAAHGPMILHVGTGTTNGHWIVVDSVNADGTINVRDPIDGLVLNATLGPNGRYRLAGDHQVHYLSQAS